MQRTTLGPDAVANVDVLTDQIFDGVLLVLDGTLIDSMPGAIRAWHR